MKKRSPTSVITSLNMLDDATAAIRHEEGKVKKQLDTLKGTIDKTHF